MCAPGEAVGLLALECAMDEFAEIGQQRGRFVGGE
jgi:hypothetical protein